MKHICAAGLLCLAFCTSSFAQQPSPEVPATREDVEKYLEVTHSHELMLKTMDALSVPMHKMFHDQFVKNQGLLPPDFEAQMQQRMDDMLKNLPWEDILQAMVPAYEKHFSKNDLEALTAFYSSSTGQKILREMPAVTAEAMQNVMPIMQNYMEGVTHRLQREMEARVREADKTSVKNPSPTH